jgi:hypothetical protein
MSAKVQTATILFLAMLAAMLGIGAIAVFATPLQAQAAALMSALVTGSLVIATPASWLLAGLFEGRLNTYAPASAYRFA